MGFCRSILKYARSLPAIGLMLAALLVLPSAFAQVGFSFWKPMAAAVAIGCNAITGLGPDYSVNNVVNAVVSDGTTTFIGGQFTTVGGLPRTRISAFENSTGNLLPFNTEVNGPVNALSLNAGKLYVGGSFTAVGAGTLSDTKAVETNTSLVINGIFPKVTGGTILAAVADGAGGWYIGGTFTNVGGTARNYIAQVNSDGSVASFAPTLDAAVSTLALNGGILYVGGMFSNANSQIRINVAAFDAAGTLQSFNPSIVAPGSFFGSGITGFAFNSTDVIIAGLFSAVNVSPTNNLISTPLAGGSYKTIPSVDGQVMAVVPDGSGGWIIGGTFTKVGTTTRNGIARIDNNGNLTSWNPAGIYTTYVTSIVVDGSFVYVGGSFTRMGGQLRTNLAQLNLSNGTATSLNANTDAIVVDLEVSGTDLFVAGQFSTIKSVSRTYLAKLALSNFAVNGTWNPAPNAAVRNIDIEGTSVYVSGSFSSIGGQSRFSIAALDTTSGLATSFAPAVNNEVYYVDATSTGIFLTGEFTTVNSVAKNYIAEVDAAGALTSWAADPSLLLFTGSATRITATSDRVYFSVPSFFTPGGLFVLSRSTGLIDSTFDIGLVGDPQAIAVSGTEVFVAGVIGVGTKRALLAAFDPATGAVQNQDAQIMGLMITSMVQSGGKLYISGYLGAIQGQVREYLAALDENSFNLDAWAPTVGAGGSVTRLLAIGSNIIVGGSFSTLAGSSRTNLGAVSASTGAIVSGFNPGSGAGTVSDMTTDGTNIYVAGSFPKGTQVRAFSASTGATVIGSYNTFASSGQSPSLIRHQGSKLLISGDWTTVGGSPRSNLAAFDTTTGAVESFAPEPDGEVNAMVNDGARLYIGGNFDNIGATSRAKLGSITISSGAVTGWAAYTNGRVRTMQLNSGTLYLGGDFSSIRATARNYIGAISSTTNTVPTWNPNANGPVYSMQLSGTNMYVGGIFTAFGATTRNYLAKIPLASSTPSAWDPNPNGYVLALSVFGTGVYVGGSFSTVSGTARPFLALLDDTSASLIDWQPNVDNTVRALRTASGALWAGGDFTAIGGSTARQRYGVISTCSGTN